MVGISVKNLLIAGCLLLLLPAPVHASSRLIVSEATALPVRVELDFTIVIPAFLSVSEQAKAATSRFREPVSPVSFGPTAVSNEGGSLVITANAGTVAVGLLPLTLAESRQISSVPDRADRRVYAVSLP